MQPSCSTRAPARRPGRYRLALALLAVATVTPPLVAGLPGPAEAETGLPTRPPAPICGDRSILDGPATPPAGSVRVEPGTDLNRATSAHPAGTTFWLAPGTHTLSDDPHGQVVPKDGNTYVGAPGAVLDGRRINRFAFTQKAVNVKVRHLTIQRFGAVGGNVNEGVVNHDSGRGWVVENNTIKENAGAGVMVGTDNVVRSNCIVDNGQYGLNAYAAGGASNLVVDRNEIARNNADDWEKRVGACGCSGATKFWEISGATVTGNWVHHNRGPGLWADTNNVGFRIEGNWIEDNDDEGIFYELSYNARIADNVLRRNALAKGRTFAARGDNFPIGAIYVSESGGDARVNGGTYSTLEITGNLLEDNWGGVVLWENADRFCNSPANSSTGYCTRGGQATLAACAPGSIEAAPYYGDCRWRTQNVSVHHNDLRFARANVGCTTTGCGQQAVFSNYGTFPDWSPYRARAVQDAITWSQSNRFHDNTYSGDWRFVPWEPGNWKAFDVWRSTFGQDKGSTLNGSSVTTTTTAPATTTTTAPATNALDRDTSGMEGTAGRWVPWFSAGAARSTEAARSGAASLRVEVTRLHGWGVTQDNWPGFAASPGAKTLGFWARTPGGGDLGVDMHVHWRDGAGATLRSDTVGLAALGGTWQQASGTVDAPAGTARVGVDFTSAKGVPGSVLFVDDVTVADAGTAGGGQVAPAPAANLLDADSSGFEASAGSWAPWFSAAAAPSTAQARSGGRSLRIEVTAPHGWGVHQTDWPGFAAGPGPKTISFWGRAGAGTGLGATLTVRWRDATGRELGTDAVSVPSLGATWVRVAATVLAPPGTARAAAELTHASGTSGSVLFVDDVAVVDGGLPGTEVLDADTATLEGSAGKWVPWFASKVTASNAAARTGTRSLRVEVTAAHGWGVTQSNWPGFTAAPGPKTIGFAARAGSGSGLAATMHVHWRDRDGATLRTDQVVATGLGATWSQVSMPVSAPAGTTRVAVDVTSATGKAGDVLFLDDFTVVEG